MASLQLRTKLLVSLLLISSSLTCATLWIVHDTIRTEVRKRLFDDLSNSVETFKNVQRQREVMLARSAGLISDLPSVRALMTTHDAATIQDASQGIWQLAGSDLFVLADRAGRVVALHSTVPGFSRTLAEEQLGRHFPQEEIGTWWSGGGHLYEVFIQPIYFGAATEDRVLGILAIGYDIDEPLAREVSRIASSQVAVHSGNTILVSTLSPSQEKELGAHFSAAGATAGPAEVVLGGEHFLATTLALDRNADGSAQLTVLKSYDQAAAFLYRLNRLLLALGVAAVFCGSLLVYLISRTFTRPLEDLAAGVKALERGDFVFPLRPSGDDEVAVVTNAFAGMRRNLQVTQQKLLQSERLATIGLMASSISHDLRHPLTAILANSEFLSEARLNGNEREDLYQEIRAAVHRMNDLIESLLEFSRGRESLQITDGRIEDTLMRAVHAIEARPEFQSVTVKVTGKAGEIWGDHKRLERVFYNVLLNACEASPANSTVQVLLEKNERELRIVITDSGTGIADEIRGRLFEPFVSHGKENGTGLGLTIAEKIAQDHGGSLRVVSSSSSGTSFELRLPLSHPRLSNSIAQRPSSYAAPSSRQDAES
jgi:signal transduction histidine kinase